MYKLNLKLSIINICPKSVVIDLSSIAEATLHPRIDAFFCLNENL